MTVMEFHDSKVESSRRLYAPIGGGFWKLLSFLVFLGVPLYFGYDTHGAWGAFGGTFVWFLLVMANTDMKPMEYARSYIGKNVVGFRLWFTLNKHGDLDVIGALNRSQTPAENHALCIGLPIGGWFIGAKILRFQVDTGPWFQVKLKGNRALSMSTYFSGWRVEVTDTEGNLLKVPIDQALRVIGKAGIHDGAIMRYFGHIEDGYKNAEQRLTDAVHALADDSAKLKEAEAEKGIYVAIIDNTIRRLAATKRYIKSKEGMAVREYLREEMLNTLSEDDPKRPFYLNQGSSEPYCEL